LSSIGTGSKALCQTERTFPVLEVIRRTSLCLIIKALFESTFSRVIRKLLVGNKAHLLFKISVIEVDEIGADNVSLALLIVL
jgi:hypothetical protein